MKIIHRQGKLHSNADGLSRLTDREIACDCYEAGTTPESLPCGGCPYCTRAHKQWSRFHEEVDDVIPLAVWTIHASVESPFSDAAPDPVTILGAEPSEEGVPAMVLGPRQSHSPSRVVGCEPERSLDTGLEAGEVVTEAGQSSATDDRALVPNWLDGHTLEELRQEQMADPDLRPVIDWLEVGAKPSQQELLRASPATKALWLCHPHLHLRQGVLFYRWNSDPLRTDTFVVPVSLREEVLGFCHDSAVSGHMGQNKTYMRLKRSFLWHNMAKDCNAYVRSCAICNRSKKPHIHARAGLGMYCAGSPMERVHIDILGPFITSRRGNKYILSMVDQFSKWIELAAIPEQTAEEVAKQFLLHFIVTFGCPIEVHSDQGRNFGSNLFKALCDLLQIAKTRTTPYRLCSNGQVERYNRVILQYLRSFVGDHPDCWDDSLPLLAMALHSMVHRQTGYSPNQLMLGREVLQPVDLLMGTLDSSGSNTPSQWLIGLVQRLNKAHSSVRERLARAQMRQKRTYDLRLVEKTYDLGDIVYRLDSSTKVGAKALQPFWKGPFVITRCQPPLYKLQGKRASGVWHHDKLKLCQDRDLPLWVQRLRGQVLGGVEEVEEENLESEPSLNLDTLWGRRGRRNLGSLTKMLRICRTCRTVATGFLRKLRPRGPLGPKELCDGRGICGITPSRRKVDMEWWCI